MTESESRLARLKEENRSLRARIESLESSLREETRRLSETNDLLAGIIASREDLIAAQDTEFRYLAFNRIYQEETRRIFGAEIAIGASMVEALAHLPEEQRRAVALWERALRGESFTTTEEFGDPGRDRRIFDINCTPLRDRQGKLFGAAHIVRDVTARVRAERALRESEEEFRAFFDNVAVGCGQVDMTGRFVRVNDRYCQITGYSREELLAISPQDLTHPDDRDEDWALFQSFLRGERPDYCNEKRYVRKSGEEIWVQVAAGLVRDPEGKPLRTVAVIQDVTERRRMEEDLRQAKTTAEQASRAKSEFLANVSHEIRTPMTIFLTAVEYLQQTEGDAERRKLLEIATEGIQRLSTLVDDILDFSRMEAKKVRLRQTPFDLQGWVGKVIDLLTIPAGKKNIRLELEIAPEIPRIILGDPDRLGQVLTNLIGNGVKFTETGRVALTIRRQGRNLVFEVTDTGIGIPEDKRRLLFQSFSQINPSHGPKNSGAGLGLAICKELVELMGGRIAMRSRPGGGSVFLFTLPLRPVKREEAAAAAARWDINKKDSTLPYPAGDE